MKQKKMIPRVDLSWKQEKYCPICSVFSNTQTEYKTDPFGFEAAEKLGQNLRPELENNTFLYREKTPSAEKALNSLMKQKTLNWACTRLIAGVRKTAGLKSAGLRRNLIHFLQLVFHILAI